MSLGISETCIGNFFGNALSNVKSGTLEKRSGASQCELSRESADEADFRFMKELVIDAYKRTRDCRGRTEKGNERVCGGELEIRTLDTLSTYTRLAGVRLQPLGQLSADNVAAAT